jgi:APA family basic amino acid/polyamine antiporter
VIGAAVFAQPSLYAANVGAWSPFMVAAGGLATLLVALSFAEVSSRFDATGGPYLYTRAAFGRFPAFEVGWMLWFSRVASWAAVINVLTAYLGFYVPALTAGWPRAALMAGIIAAIAAINVRGIRQSSVVVNSLTIGKLLPLVVFIVVGALYVEPARLVPDQSPAFAQVSSTVLLLMFAFGGFEVVPVVAGEARDPRRGIPFALIMTIVIVTVVMTLVQVVAHGTLPNLAASKTPLSDASLIFMGAGGAALITLGAVFSTTGNNMGQALSGSRNLFALAEQGDLPRVFGWVHPRFRTPATAVLFTSGVSLVLAISGTYATMALVSAVSRLVVYLGTCASTLRLRSASHAGKVQPAAFVVPFGSLIPSAAILVALFILLNARREQLIAGGIALVAGAILYLVATRAGAPAAHASTQQDVRTNR